MCPMSVNPPIHPVSTCLSTCLNILCTHPLTYIIIHACIHPCIYASMHACIHPSRDCLFIYPFSDYAFVHPLPSTHTTIYPAHLSICPSTYLPTCVPTYPSVNTTCCLFSVACMCIISGLSSWFWISNEGAYFWGRLILPLSVLVNPM